MNSINSLLQSLRAYKYSHVLATAVDIGILDALSESKKNLDDLSVKCHIRPGYLQCFLNILIYSSLIEKDGNLYRLSPLGEEVSQNNVFRSFSSYHRHTFGAWNNLFIGCRTGSLNGNFHRQKIEDPAFCQAYLESMEAMSQKNLLFIANKCNKTLTGQVLDIGAGPSTVCRYMAMNNRCNVVGLDFPPIVNKTCNLFTYPNNFRWEAVDFFDYDPYDSFDAIYCGHLLEYFSDETLFKWLAKVTKLIQPDGSLVLVVFLRTDDSDKNIDLELFQISTGLNGFELGQIRTFFELRKALLSYGYYDINIFDLPGNVSYPEFLVTCRSGKRFKSNDLLE